MPALEAGRAGRPGGTGRARGDPEPQPVAVGSRHPRKESRTRASRRRRRGREACRGAEGSSCPPLRAARPPRSHRPTVRGDGQASTGGPRCRARLWNPQAGRPLAATVRHVRRVDVAGHPRLFGDGQVPERAAQVHPPMGRRRRHAAAHGHPGGGGAGAPRLPAPGASKAAVARVVTASRRARQRCSRSTAPPSHRACGSETPSSSSAASSPSITPDRTPVRCTPARDIVVPQAFLDNASIDQVRVGRRQAARAGVPAADRPRARDRFS